MSVPTISSYLPKEPDERSISAWKTMKVDQQDGHHWVQITNGTDGNEHLLDRIVEVVRFEHGGDKIIFKSPKEERSISAWKTMKVDQQDGHHWVQIINGSDGNEHLLGRIVKVVRFEQEGGKIIFNI